MYKIYINSIPVFLTDTTVSTEDLRDRFNLLRIPYAYVYTSKKELSDFLDTLDHTLSIKAVHIRHDDIEELRKILFSFFKVLMAAGGVAINEQNDVLMIFRKGKWDLPKGKVENDEMIEQGALREMEEETGLKGLTIERKIKFFEGMQDCTIHTYWENGSRLIKLTYWFVMASRGLQDVVPQKEEGITRAIWVPKDDMATCFKNCWASVKDVIEASGW